MTKQRWVAKLAIIQECDDDMTLEEIKEWLQNQFQDCDYGRANLLYVEEVAPEGEYCGTMEEYDREWLKKLKEKYE